MGKFFANQKLDEAGLVGISLQKLLVFFMILDAVWLFCGYSFFASFMGILFHFVVFMGVYRRRTAVLLFYVVFHVAMFIIGALAIILVVSALMYMPSHVDPLYPAGGQVNYTHGNDTYIYNYPQGGVKELLSRFVTGQNRTANHTGFKPMPAHPGKNNTHTARPPVHPSPVTPAHPHPFPTPATDVGYGSSDYSDYVSDDQSIFILSIGLLLVSVVILYCKILSVVLAHRMRKMLLAANNSSASNASADTEAQKQPETAEPVYVPAADFENAHPLFSQPNFMPYQPMVQAPQNFYPGQASAMMPPPFMYGQQPVFYTFAPMPQYGDNNENNEQL